MSKDFLLAVSIACLLFCGPIWLLGLALSGGNLGVALAGIAVVGLPILKIVLVIGDRRKLAASERAEKIKRA